jgi:hypothetical protein
MGSNRRFRPGITGSYTQDLTISLTVLHGSAWRPANHPGAGRFPGVNNYFRFVIQNDPDNDLKLSESPPA